MAVAAARLPDMESLLEFPDPRGDWMDHRHLQVLLDRLDDGKRAPARAEHVDRIGALGLEEVLLDMGIDLLARKLLHLVEGDIDARHSAYGEAGIAEIFGKDVVEPVRK